MEVSLLQDEQYQNNKVKGCILPWIHLFGGLQGTYHLCCHSEFSSPNSVSLGNSRQSLNDVWNGDPIKKARLSFLRGEDIPECVETCYKLENSGGISNRLQVNKRFADKAYLQGKTKEDGSVDNFPSYLDIRFGNLCNFRCRMCGPYASTSWYRDSTKKYSKTIDHYTDNEKFWVEIEKYLPFIEDIYFAGGEPFVQDGHYKMLNLLIDKGFSTSISLQYNTNLSYSKFKNFDLLSLWDKFKDVSLWPSVEGWTHKAEYSRKGLDWGEFQANVLKFKKHIKTCSSVINIYSISSMPNLILWFKNQGIDYFGTVLTNPSYLSITCLPKESKKMINLMYKKFLNEYKSILTPYDIEQIVKWLKYMNSADNSHLLKEFKHEQVRLDLLRNESFESVFPEFAEWYNNI